MDALVPNFILQPLVENAVKHGVAPHRGKARVLVRATAVGDALTITTSNHSNVGRPAEPEGAPNGGLRCALGLTNVRQRLAVLYGDQARLETRVLDDGYASSVTLPLRRA
jgi:LytS/YehU family sensor histidine kinase